MPDPTLEMVVRIGVVNWEHYCEILNWLEENTAAREIREGVFYLSKQEEAESFKAWADSIGLNRNADYTIA